jgi:hypothetical protein
VAGTPSQQRHIEADRTRVRDLRNIALAVKNSYARNASIPTTLGGLPIRHQTDPETNAPYEYHPKLGTYYALCATFAANERGDASSFWNHTAGSNCFVLDASAPVPW